MKPSIPIIRCSTRISSNDYDNFVGKHEPKEDNSILALWTRT